MPEHSNLLAAFDAYGDFSITKYFAVIFGAVPSNLSIYLDAEDNRENFQQALTFVNTEYFALEQVAGRWTVSENKEDIGGDYIYSQVLKSSRYALCLKVELISNQLIYEFYYQQGDEALLTLLESTISAIRGKYGSVKSPVFHILSSSANGFQTERVKIDHCGVDIERNYNDDFEPIDTTIRAGIAGRKSGLILLYGKPGTGKTTYIKSLMSAYPKQRFIYIPNEFIVELLKPNFVTFLIKQKNAILIIEDAEKSIVARDQAHHNSVVSTILQLTDGLFSDYLNIRVICTFNIDVSKIDKALFRKGRLLAFYKFEELSLGKTRQLLADESEPVTEGMTLAEIFNRNEKDYSPEHQPKQIGFHVR